MAAARDVLGRWLQNTFLLDVPMVPDHGPVVRDQDPRPDGICGGPPLYP